MDSYDEKKSLTAGQKDTESLLPPLSSNPFSTSGLQEIDTYINDIFNGKTDFVRFNTPEHAGLCRAGKVLIGAEIIASYARRSIGSGGHAGESQTGSPDNWQIDAVQEEWVERWARATEVWFDDADEQIEAAYGPQIAAGAEAIVYYRSGETSVVKERTSIYSTLQKAFDAIALHNHLFPESSMQVIGFTRSKDGLFRTILTQPYIRCERQATKREISDYVASKGLHPDEGSFTESYINERIVLEDMHPANVFINAESHQPLCIDCIVKFKP